MTETIELTPLGIAEWDKFIDGRPEALPYHTSAWLNFLSRVYKLEWEGLGAWVGSSLVGVVPLVKRRLGPFRLCGSPLMLTIASTPYLAPLADPEWQIPILEAFHLIQRSTRIDYMEFAFPGMLAELQSLASLGYTLEMCQKVVLELQDRTAEQLWSSLDEACRRAIRKAEANAVNVVECQDAGFIDEYYQMAREVYRTVGREPHLSKSFYAQLWNTFANSGMLKVYLALYKDRILAGGIFLAYKSTVHYLSGVSYDNSQPLRANNLIQWHLIQWAAENKYANYDLGGAVVAGITRFKLSFGGRLVPFLRIYRANSRIARFGRWGYQLTIPLWRRLIALYRSRFTR